MGKVKYDKQFKDKFIREFCIELATSHISLRTFCKKKNVPASSVIDWINEDKDYAERYARAKEMQADFLAEEIIEISEHREEDHTAFTGSNVVQRDRLRIDARKWVAAKLKPQKYGDRVQQDVTVKAEQPLFGENEQ